MRILLAISPRSRNGSTPRHATRAPIVHWSASFPVGGPWVRTTESNSVRCRSRRGNRAPREYGGERAPTLSQLPTGNRVENRALFRLTKRALEATRHRHAVARFGRCNTQEREFIW